MTISLTVEELREYQTRMEDWTSKAMQSEALVKAASTCERDMRFSSSPLQRLHAEAKKWMDENPMPKLVPKELEA